MILDPQPELCVNSTMVAHENRWYESRKRSIDTLLASLDLLCPITFRQPTLARRFKVDKRLQCYTNYAEAIRCWSVLDIAFPPHTINRMESDIRSIGRIRKSIKDEQLEALLNATDALLAAMQPNYGDEAIRIERIFKELLLGSVSHSVTKHADIPVLVVK
jgi:Universal stress protein family